MFESFHNISHIIARVGHAWRNQILSKQQTHWELKHPLELDKTNMDSIGRLVSCLSLLQGRDALNKVRPAAEAFLIKFSLLESADPPIHTEGFGLEFEATKLHRLGSQVRVGFHLLPSATHALLPLRSSHAAASTISEARRIFRAGAFIGHMQRLKDIDFSSSDVFGVAHFYSAVRHTCLAAYFSCDALLLLGSLSGRTLPQDSTYRSVETQAHKFWSVGLVAALAQDIALMLQVQQQLNTARLLVQQTHGKLQAAQGSVLQTHNVVTSNGLSPASPLPAARRLWPHGDASQMAPPPPNLFSAAPSPQGPRHPQTPQPGQPSAASSTSKDPKRQCDTPAASKSPPPSPIPPSDSPTHINTPHSRPQSPGAVSLPTVHRQITSLAEAAQVLLAHRAQVRRLRAALSAVRWRLVKVSVPQPHLMPCPLKKASLIFAECSESCRFFARGRPAAPSAMGTRWNCGRGRRRERTAVPSANMARPRHTCAIGALTCLLGQCALALYRVHPLRCWLGRSGCRGAKVGNTPTARM